MDRPTKQSNTHSSFPASPQPRYQVSRPAKSTAIPDGWIKDKSAVSRRDSTMALLESVSERSRYSGNEKQWDRVLEFLNLKLNFQPAVAKVIGENRWRSAPNPKAYVATAAFNQGLSMRLADRLDKGFKVTKRGDGRNEIDHSPDVHVDHEGNEVLGSNQDWPDVRESHRVIPGWLQYRDEYDRIDWRVVAEHAALKAQMVESLSLTLSLRYEQHLSRDAAIKLASKRGQRQNVEAAWKWIDRNFDTRIRPLFHMERPPEISYKAKQVPPKHHSRKTFVAPWEVLRGHSRLVVARNPDYMASPSLKQSEMPIKLPPGVSLVWHRGGLGIEAVIADQATGGFDIAIGETREEVYAELRDILNDWREDALHPEG